MIKQGDTTPAPYFLDLLNIRYLTLNASIKQPKTHIKKGIESIFS